MSFIYSEIMNISNKLVYADKLKCGTDDVACQTVKLTSPHIAAKVILYLISPFLLRTNLVTHKQWSC